MLVGFHEDILKMSMAGISTRLPLHVWLSRRGPDLPAGLKHQRLRLMIWA